MKLFTIISWKNKPFKYVTGVEICFKIWNAYTHLLLFVILNALLFLCSLTEDTNAMLQS